MMTFYPENVKNDESLRTLVRAIEFSQGQFSLILARCNYTNLRQRLMQQLRELCPIELRELVIEPSAKNLYTAIREDSKKSPQQAIVISGLELAISLDALLICTNQMREEFGENLSFPVVLWVTDEVLQKLIRTAPDFESWAAAPIEFEMANDELIYFIKQTTDEVFAKVLDAGAGIFLDNAALNLEIGSPRRIELGSAQKELQNRGVSLDPELEASLEFVLGRDVNNLTVQSRQNYENSLALWQTSDNLERRGCVLHSLSLWWRTYGMRHPAEQGLAFDRSKDYLQQCVEAFERANRPDLVAKFINPLGDVLQRLQQWDELEVVAKKALALHQTYSDLFRLARVYGFLAEVALAKSGWVQAQEYAREALEILANGEEIASTSGSSDRHTILDWERSFHKGWYLFALARAQLHLGGVDEAIETLETARTETKPQYDPELYISIVCELRNAYFQQCQYITAFQFKQEQYAIEQQYGFRAFIGAGRLQPKQQITNPALPYVEQETQQIFASERQQDINRLVERMSRDDHKLTVIHGQSGVGKSSILQAGLVPKLKQKIIGSRNVLPVLQQVYTDRIKELGKRLAEALVETGKFASDGIDSTASILEQLRKNAEQNLLTVLIFDQFEEFFFVCTDSIERRFFYDLLRDCLEIPFVKVILSLREDYLHYLLEFQRITSLQPINNNILDKNILYYLGNFSAKDAKLVIQNLTGRSKFYLQPDFIDELVRDLAGDFGEVRPIELQVVGAQLQTENITTLAQYRQRGPKKKLVERYLEEVVKDCGPENERAAQLVLYLLTDENNTRPLKTRTQLAVDLAAEADKLDLVLEIFVKSRLVFLLPETPADRYQLVHDYLVAFIRQQKGAALIAELEEERKQRRISDRKLNRFLKRALVGSTAAVVLLSISTVSALIFAQQAQREKNRSEIAKIEALNAASEALLLSHDRLGALTNSVKAGKQLLATKVSDNLLHQTEETLRHAIVSDVREVNRLQGHSDWVNAVSFSPDDETIATASADKTIKLWRRNGQEIRTLSGHNDRVTSISFSPNGETLASADGKGIIKLWRYKDGKEIKTFLAHKGWIFNVIYSPNGETLASASKDKTVKLWRKDGTLLKTLGKHDDRVTGLSFSPDGKTLASASLDGIIKLWSSKDGKEIKTFKAHNKWLANLSFSPDGQILASASDDDTIKFWNKDGKLLKTIPANSNKVYRIRFSPDGKTLASAGEDSTLKIWRVNDGILLHTLQGHKGSLVGISFKRDGKTIASASTDTTVRIWQLDSTSFQTIQVNSVDDVIFSPDGKTIASASNDDKLIKIWRLNGTLIQNIQGVSGFVSFSPDGKTLALGGDNHTIKLLQLNGKQVKILAGHKEQINTVSFSPDGQMLASASNDNTIKLWRKNSVWPKTFNGHTRPVCCVSFSRNNQIIASAGDDNTVKLWQLDGKELATIRGHSDRVTSISFSPDGQTIASGSVDKTIKLWGKDGKLIHTFQGHNAAIASVSFSPDGQMLVSGSDDKTIKIWRKDGTLFQTLQGHNAKVNAVNFSPDGQRLVSASDDKTIIIWNWKILRDLDLDNLLDRGCNLLHDYLKTNANVSEDRDLCKSISVVSPTSAGGSNPRLIAKVL
ncbi:eIF2A-related protein [Argonema galeatum]|uniref:WD40 domain-containing protein n=1 Tax=Argonema galeatum TaxID=2942762 RepID=UPI002012DD19|nr:hypothetical protein [Argonema galeatum]MCL1467184.1 hypothetical protein [Argonema galeatum A003/A1]